MRIFKHSFTDRQGKTCETSRFYAEFKDHLEIRRRVALFADLRSSEEAGRMIERLVSLRSSNATPDAQMTRWLSTVNPSLRDALARIGVIEAARVEAAKPLSQHLSDWAQHLRSKGSSEQHITLQARRAETILNACKFVFVNDLAPAPVRQALESLRDNGLSAQTSNHYLQTIKGFSKWLCREGRAPVDALTSLAPLNKKTLQKDMRVRRRAFTETELRQLLSITPTQPERYGLTGFERTLLYRLACETGLRSSELAALTVQDFHLDAGVVELSGAATKNGRVARQPLREDLVGLLREHLQNKLPAAVAFTMPSKDRVADMLRADLDAAGVDYSPNAAGERLDFHCMRHSFITLLANAGCHPKTAMDLARHSDINLTLARYSHSLLEQRAEAVAKLPTWQTAAAEVQCEGTTGAPVTANATTCNTKQATKTVVASGVNAFAQQGLNSVSCQFPKPEVVGSNPAGNTNVIGETVQPSLTESTENRAETPSRTPRQADSDLDQLAQVWPSLPQHLKDTILLLAKTGGGKP